MEQIFFEVDFRGSQELNFLQQLGAMHMGATVEKDAKNTLDFEDVQADVYIGDMVARNGLPADWAFTVCNLLFSVHWRLLKDRKFDTANILRRFVLENYGFNLRLVKQAAFFANLVASLHYDCNDIKVMDRQDDIMHLGSGAFVLITSNGKAEKNLELRIYAAFTRLIIADIMKQLNKKLRNRGLIKELRVENISPIYEAGLGNLWEFLCHYNQMIEDPGFQFKSKELLERDTKWKQAICSDRHLLHVYSDRFA